MLPYRRKVAGDDNELWKHTYLVVMSKNGDDVHQPADGCEPAAKPPSSSTLLLAGVHRRHATTDPDRFYERDPVTHGEAR